MSIHDDEVAATQSAFGPGANIERIRRKVRPTFDDDAYEPSDLSTYHLADERGPAPVPDDVITNDGAQQRDLGLIKTGKEAEVWLVERTVPGRRQLLAAKRFRSMEHTSFRSRGDYATGRSTMNTRTDRAIAKGSRFGAQMAASHWVSCEFDALRDLWLAGLPVPYPVQRNDTEILMQYLGDDDGPALRLVDARPSPDQLDDLWQQAGEILLGISRAGLVHGDLSAYNLLLLEDRLWLIDLPQAVRVNHNDKADDLLLRDVKNLSAWFTKRGVATDDVGLYAKARNLAWRA